MTPLDLFMYVVAVIGALIGAPIIIGMAAFFLIVIVVMVIDWLERRG